ncbi:MAG: type II toxin-antitoxin system RelE/ParE family toxin [Chloroflexota bacterium]|nr:type II toxin-antitoxin system RelE/ParE family toxin [Chloroflexota bacterium]
MIKSFGCKETATLYNFRKISTKFPGDIQERARKKLRILNAAISLNDLKSPPSNRLHKLEKEWKGQWSISINDQWRICFTWHEGNAYDVEITDYH